MASFSTYLPGLNMISTSIFLAPSAVEWTCFQIKDMTMTSNLNHHWSPLLIARGSMEKTRTYTCMLSIMRLFRTKSEIEELRLKVKRCGMKTSFGTT
jgi:hypothetical protein